MRLAILGTGTMGAGMARSAKREGLDVVVWNRTRARAEPLAADGVEVADTVTAAVTGADAVMTMLFDTDSVLAVTDELVGALAPDAVWLQAATVGPDGIGRIARAAGDVALLDAPVLGTKAPAEQGKLVPLVSGPAALIEKAGPVLDAIGTKTVVAGDTLGAGSALKLEDGELRYTASFGVAGFEPHQPVLDRWLGRADDALYEAKAKGRNRVELARGRQLAGQLA